MLCDNRFDISARLGDYRVAFIGPIIGTQTTEHRFDIGTRGVAERARDERAVSIARSRAARRSSQRIAQPLMQVGRDPLGPVGRSEEHTSELQSLMRSSD